MGKLVVAVKSCQRDRNAGFHDAIRETWGRELKNLGVEVKFFLGHSGINGVKGHMQGNQGREALILQRDETVVDAADDYISLPHKTRGIAKWATDRMVDQLFLCDNDTLINVKELMKLPFQTFDYSGYFRGGQSEVGRQFYYKDHMGEYPNCYPWASGGLGYFISKKAVMLIADAFPKVWAEDMYVGQVLGPEIKNGTLLGGALSISGIATRHYLKVPPNPAFTPDLLRRMYRDGGPENVYAEARNAK